MRTESPDQNKRLVQTIYQDCINAGRLDLLDDLISIKFAGPNGQKGPSGFASGIQELQAGFPDIHFTLEDLVAEEDRVVVRWRWEGNHTGSFRGLPPMQKRVNNTGIVIYQIDHGKVIRAWVETDRLGALQQMGVVPTHFVPGTQPAR
jgi:predicted ester cyclase